MIKVSLNSKMVAHRRKVANGDVPATTTDITQYLDQHVVGQDEAKRAVALAHRSRSLKAAITDNSWDNVRPNNILMTGPSGVGKTELARQLAKMSNAPFVKVEITQYTQVGYYGKDVETILTDLVKEAIRIAPEIYKAEKAIGNADEEIGYLRKIFDEDDRTRLLEKVDYKGEMTWEIFLDMYRQGKLKDVTIGNQFHTEIMAKANNVVGVAKDNLQREDIVGCIVAALRSKETVKYDDLIKSNFDPSTAKKLIAMRGTAPANNKIYRATNLGGLTRVELRTLHTFFCGNFRWGLIPTMEALKKANQNIEIPDDFIVKLVEERGIVFIDEVDKIFFADKSGNPGTTGVIRDLMPLLDGIVTEVSASSGRMDRYLGRGETYQINTANILWIASGAFMMVPVTAIPAEILGRLPVHVQLKSFTADDLEQIILKPHGSELDKVKKFMAAEGIEFHVDAKAVRAIAELTYDCNLRGENTGARRLFGVFHRLFHELQFNASSMESGTKINIDKKFIMDRYQDILDSIPPHK